MVIVVSVGLGGRVGVGVDFGVCAVVGARVGVGVVIVVAVVVVAVTVTVIVLLLLLLERPGRTDLSRGPRAGGTATLRPASPPRQDILWFNTFE